MPEDWPNPNSTKVAKTSTWQGETYWNHYSSQLRNEPAVGLNVMLMQGGSFPDSPHMAIAYQFSNNKIEVTHYTESAIRNGDSKIFESYTDLQNKFSYTQFMYLPLGL